MTTRDLPASIPAQNTGIPFPVFADRAASKTFQTATGLLSRAWKWIQERQVARSSTRRLKVAETVSLGEKRFVAVVEVDGLQFLLGGGATNVTLLAQLNATETFGEVLKETMNPPKKQTVKRMRKRTAQRTAEQTGEQA
jgi:hypothetical protein